MAENVIITKTARAKLVQARAGAITLPTIVGMAFGNGGVDSSGDVISPTDDQTELTSELLRKEIDSYTVLTSEDATVRYMCTLGTSDLEGESISEIGLYDTDGDIVCIKTFTAKGKDSDIEMTFTLDDVF
ncbi:MAG: phage tail protein [Clostridiales bacterium]|nr:phage tail protein [Clostridiales bacterium]